MDEAWHVIVQVIGAVMNAQYYRLLYQMYLRNVYLCVAILLSIKVYNKEL